VAPLLATAVQLNHPRRITGRPARICATRGTP
jgi:hypothetical protein